jgi:LmbE family N-acetylglucosaminyl deacetylase
VGGNALRRAEERAAADLLGLDLVLLDYPDAVYRHGRYLGHDDIFGAIHPAEADLPAELAAAIEATIQARSLGPDTVLYAPLGLGHHVDHQLVYEATALLARQGRRVVHYEDFPYAAKPDAHAARFAELGASPDLTPQPPSLEGKGEFDSPPRGGAGPGERTFAPHYCVIDAGIETKIAAIAAYRSQISSLFPSLEAMPEAVRAYGAEVAAAGWAAAGDPAARGRYAERYWRRHGV